VEGFDVSNNDDEIVPDHMKRTQLFDNHRFERFQHYQTVQIVRARPSRSQGMEVRNSRFSVFIDAYGQYVHYGHRVQSRRSYGGKRLEHSERPHSL
jgi:hypothetical protein